MHHYHYKYDPTKAHVFKDGIYIGFELDGKLYPNWSEGVKNWVDIKITEQELLGWLEEARFEKKI